MSGGHGEGDKTRGWEEIRHWECECRVSTGHL